MIREQQAYKRLFSGAKKPAQADLLNPAKVMEITGPGINPSAQIRFEQKHGVWFWITHTRCPALFDLEGWGFTEHAIYRLCRKLNLQWRWL